MDEMTDLARDVEPWVKLVELVETEDGGQLEAFLASLTTEERARTLSRLSEDEIARTMTLLGPEQAAAALHLLSDVQAAEIVEDLPAEQAASIVDELPSADKADILGEMDAEDAEAILERMEPAEASEARQLLRYDSATAGGLMITEYVAFRDESTVAQVLANLRENAERYSDYEIQYAYIVDARGLLLGVLRLRDLLLARQEAAPIRSIMIPEAFHITVDAPLEELQRVFSDHGFVGIPVTLADGKLVGVVRRSAMEHAIGERETETFLKFSGLMRAEEIRTMPILERASRRLSWLSINIGLNVLAASVIAFYQDTLAAVIALAVFLPIISDMSGCSGNQAVAVSIRELSLGLVKPYEYVRVLLKEAAVGLINGVVLGVLLGAVAVLWKGNFYLGLVVGAALALNTLLAVMLGGSIPLALKALKLDPALASGPILTTVTDMCGFFLVLSFASLALSLLTG